MDSEITPEFLDYLSALGVSEDKLAELRFKMQDGMQRRDAQGPQGNVAGGIYVAANPLQHLAHGINQYQGRKDMMGAEQGIAQTIAEQQAARRAASERVAALRGLGGGMGMNPSAQMLREEYAQMGPRGA